MSGPITDDVEIARHNNDPESHHISVLFKTDICGMSVIFLAHTSMPTLPGPVEWVCW